MDKNMNNKSDNPLIPAGIVLSFAGTYNETNLKPAGWLYCDGDNLKKDENPDLFKAIGTLNGGDGSNFNLPDYRGVFLRGIAGTTKNDPDKDDRIAAKDGGASGNNAGSYQEDATALPVSNKIHMEIKHMPNSSHQAYNKGVHCDLVDWERREDVEAVSSLGGDLESRPVNLYFDFIIQSLNQYSGDDNARLLPAGLLVAMTALQVPANWMLCNGTLLNGSANQDLYNAIGTGFGGTDGNFNLPDLRGSFIRGRSNGSGNDPDAANRTSSATGGSTGDAVGSRQICATAKPKNQFTAKLEHCPKEKDTKGKCKGNDETAWKSGDGIVDFGTADSAWDKETRPININVDWYINYGKATELPVGSIVAIAGNNAPSDNYLLCDGKSYSVAKYQDLFDVIGTLNGGDGTTFNVPDCRGMFLRGVDHGKEVDPDAESRQAPVSGAQSGDNPGSVQGYATMKPGTAIQGKVPHLPTKDYHETASGALSGGKVAARNKDWTNYDIKGGDKESRPVNIYVGYYIKSA